MQFLAFCSSIFHSRPVHSLMLSSHRFFCLPLRLPPWTVPCRIVLASPDDRVTCPYHLSLHLFTEARRSSYSPMAFTILAFTSSLVMWSLYEIPRSLLKHKYFHSQIITLILHGDFLFLDEQVLKGKKSHLIMIGNVQRRKFCPLLF